MSTRILILVTLLGGLAVFLGCGGKPPEAPPSANGDTPTEAYKRLYNAVKAKDMNAIKAAVTKKTVDFAQAAAKQYGKPEDGMLENGMTATTFADTIPTIRDERIKENMGAVEVWNWKESKWEDLPFMIEDGQWKLAIAEAFRGTWHSPGPGRDQREKQAANALNSTVNTNAGTAR